MNQSEKICLVCHPYTARKDIGAGGDRYSFEILKHLKKQFDHIQVIEAGIYRSLIPAILGEISFQLKLPFVKASLYHAVTSVSGFSTIFLWKKRPLVTTVHDLISLKASEKNDSSWKFKYKRFCIMQVIRHSDAIIVPFRSTYDELRDTYGVPEDKMTIIPYGVDHEQFFPGEKPVNKVKKVLFVGAMNKGKGVDTLIQAWDRVKDVYGNVELHLASKGWNTEFLLNLVDQLKHKDSVKRIGFIPEEKLRQAYIDADIMIFPSRYGFGLSTLEAMACGTPTISGSVLDAPEFVEDAGLLVDPDSPEDVAEKILMLLQDDTLYKSLITRGKAKAAQYRWEISAKMSADLYRKYLK